MKRYRRAYRGTGTGLCQPFHFLYYKIQQHATGKADIQKGELTLDGELTLEQLREIVEQQTQTINELTAERDSLRQEADVSRETLETTKKELHDTKAMNYTLARQLDVSKKEESPESILFNLYGKRRK